MNIFIDDGGGGGGGGGGSGWNAADQAPGQFAVSGADLVATPQGVSALGFMRGSDSNTAGKKYFEVTLSGTLVAGTDCWFGTADASMPLASGQPGFSFTGGAYGFYRGDSRYSNEAGFLGFSTAVSSGDVVGVGVDFTAGTFSTWRNGTPGVVSAPMNAVGATLFPCIGVSNAAETAVFNLALTAGSLTLPSGYSAWV